MTVSNWRAENRGEGITVAEYDPNLVSELLDVIRLVDNYPTKDQLLAIKRLAHAVEAEKK